MTNQPLPADYFTPDGVFLLKPKHRDVALGLKPYRQEITPLETFRIISNAILVLFLLSVWPIMLTSTINSWISYQDLSERQITTTAQVTDKRISSNEDKNTYYMEYSFTYPDQNGEPQQYRKEVSTSADTFHQTQIGQPITVYFVPDDPTTSQATPFTIYNTLLLTAILVGITIGVGIVLFRVRRFLIRVFQFEHHLEQNGQLLLGTLLDIEGKDDESTYAITARYRFQSPQGVTLDGKYYENSSDLNRLANHLLPPAGTPVAVWYANDKTHKIL